MKFEFQLSKLAIIDIENIFKYTLEKWSLTQAEAYFNLIHNEIDSICKNPQAGKAIDEIKKSHRCLVVKSHYIIYKVSKQIVFIDRILHQRMNIVDILNE